ncbi:hypothetical protein H0E87_014237, partial [Populus deltoides]
GLVVPWWGLAKVIVWGDMDSVFSEEILADKLSKLNGTQQCIETLSHWCIFHRSKAESVVETWDKQFHNSDMLQKVPLLYLANDILQNSKRKGNEFVKEFWKVLPAALKNVVEKGDDRGKKAVSRLVNIWEERKVFGSRARSLKEVILGEDAPPPLELNKKRSRSVKITKRDSRSTRTQPNEETEMSNCKSSVRRVRKMEKDVDVACSGNDKDPKRKTLAKELEDEENLLKQSIEKLRSIEASRVALVSLLKEALHEQVAQAQVEEASNMRRRLNGEEYVSKASTATTKKLAASSSSQMIMHSVLSSFAAEEAKNAQLTKAYDSLSKPENSLPVSDPNVFMPAQPLAAPTTHSYQSVLLPQPSMQNQTPRPPPPPPPPPPYMVSPMVSMAQQPSQIPQQQPLPLAQQQATINQQQPMSLNQQPQGPNFRPLRPHGMVYYGHPSHS